MRLVNKRKTVCRISPAPQQGSPGPWLLVPKAPLLPGILSCCLIFVEAHRLTAHCPSSKSVFDLHLLAQQGFTRSRPMACCCGIRILGFQSLLCACGHGERAHPFLGLSCYSRSGTGLCSPLSCRKPEVCIFPESFASAVVVTHEDELIFSSSEVTTVIPL